MGSMHISHANALFHGNGYNAGALETWGRKGVPLQSIIHYSFGLVDAPDVDGHCAAQAIAAAGNALINGALAGVNDVARGLVVDSTGAGDTTQTVTITGTDLYGATVVEAIAMNGTTAVNGLKAFKTVTQVAVDAALAGNLTVGTTDVLGLPFAAATKSRIFDVVFNDSKDASATLVVADATAATATTGDVRGTIDPATACDGLKDVTVIMMPDADNPFGVDQYAG
jgi:hypothetical protein